jgi:hypothetical protein
LQLKVDRLQPAAFFGEAGGAFAFGELRFVRQD